MDACKRFKAAAERVRSPTITELVCMPVLQTTVLKVVKLKQ